MGHYYSEMCCSSCGGIPCRCPRAKAVDPRTLWYIKSDFTVAKGSAFIVAPYVIGGYATEKKAKEDIPRILKIKISNAKEDVRRLESLLKKHKE
jgi:hypothetical protein